MIEEGGNSGIFFLGEESEENKIWYTMISPTISPITAPLLKATFNALFSDSWAWLVVRAEARVAVVIPINPASPEKNPPVRKANGVQGD